MNLELRAANEADGPFLRQLHRSAMGPHVVSAWGSWDHQEQDRRFAKEPVEKHRIVLAGSVPVGCILLLQEDGAAVLSRIWIAPEHQRRGIGTRLITALCEQAARDGQPVRLRVLKVNPARLLYARLGFGVVGETQTHFVMERGRLRLIA